ncbi:PHP domain-containing protein, partial [bacterium]|nr:PHP domain-containing protein [bacterium]
MAFVHLHLHTEYSLLDGCNRVELPVKGRPSPLVTRIKELGQTAVAITDHGVMGGVIDFYNACCKEGIKPLLGCEVYVAQRSRFDQDAHIDGNPYHLTLIAKNRQGYSNLCRLVSLGF